MEPLQRVQWYDSFFKTTVFIASGRAALVMFRFDRSSASPLAENFISVMVGYLPRSGAGTDFPSRGTLSRTAL